MKHIIIKSPSKIGAISVSFDAGSRMERLGGFTPGTAHMLEHCIFKGTDSRTSKEISREVASIGGSINAYTSHEVVSYYITAPYENLHKAAEILSDIVFNSTFPEDEFEKEVNVVLEEERSSLDNVTSFMWHSFSKEFFNGYISERIIGSQDDIKSIKRKDMIKFYKKYCKKSKAVVGISSCLSKKDSKKILVDYFGRQTSASINNYNIDCDFSYNHIDDVITKKGINSVYTFLAYDAYSCDNEKNVALNILSSIIGGGMDSRLFNSLREDLGLVYSVSCSSHSWQCSGVFSIMAIHSKENCDDVIAAINKELSFVLESGVTKEELDTAKNQAKSWTYSHHESSNSMLSDKVYSALLNEIGMDDFIRILNSITIDDINDVAKEILNKNYSKLVCMGEE